MQLLVVPAVSILAEFPEQRQFSTWTVPGIVHFTGPDRAVFRAQTDGSEWPAVRLADDDPHADAMCI
jgi:hypothetical protein